MKVETNGKNILLFDVGGTWTKMAISDGKEILSKKILLTNSFKTEDIKLIIDEAEVDFSLVILACAGPVKDGKCKMTNAAHVFDEKSLTQFLGVKVIVMNDLEAIAYCLREKYSASIIIEIGTGLGVSFISRKNEVIPSEEGHYVLEKEFFLSVPEFKNISVPQYEYLLSGKNNILIKIFDKSFVNFDHDRKNGEMVTEREIKNIESGSNDDDIYFKKDRFTNLYMQMLTSFVEKLLSIHKGEKLKRIIFTGGVVAGNEVFMTKFVSRLKKRLDKENSGINEIQIINDEYLGIKGTLEFYAEKYGKKSKTEKLMNMFRHKKV